MKSIVWPGLIALSLTLSGCNEPPATPPEAPAPTPDTPAAKGQRGGGLPYEITGSEVWDVPDPVSEREYQIFVSLPASYADNPGRRYPVLYVTDADYAFPIIKQLARRLNLDKPVVDEFILVGLSYAKGNGGMESRRRDYTPTAAGAPGTPAGTVHGGGDAYIAYLRDQVMPAVAKRYRTDEANRLFLGHSYGSLLGLQIMFSQPELFSAYILGSPSLWYDNHVMAKAEAGYAATHKDLPARAYMFVGEYEDMRPGDPRFATRYNMVSDAQAFDSTLKARRYPSLDFSLEVLNDEDHLSVAPRGFTHGLKKVLPAKEN